MRRFSLAFFWLIFFACFGRLETPLRAQHTPNPTTGPAAGHALVAELLSNRPAENSHWSGTLKISGREDKTPPVPVDCQTTLGETNWSVTYLAGATASHGAEKLTIIFSTNAPPRYFYARAAGPNAPLDEPKSLAGAEADVPFAGSDFWLSDFGFEFFHWPDQNRLKNQTKRSRGCLVLESVNPHPATGAYARAVTWLDAESNQPLQAEAYDTKGNAIKEFEVGSIEKVHGHYEVKNLKMFNRLNGSRTSLDFDLQDQ
jgi:hypothetical protein